MRRPTRQKSRKGAVAQTYSVQAPIKGWNARDSIADMAAGYAVILKNWFPTTSDVMMRKGMAAHATGLGAQAETVLVHRPTTGGHKMFASAGSNIYDVSSPGAVGAAVVTGLTSSQWQTTNFTTIGGSFSLLVNGSDEMRSYDGTTWTAINAASVPAITGVLTTNLININVFKERVWYVQKGTLDVWYTGPGAFAGALTKFSLGSIFRKGGYLVSMGTWSVDGGRGLDDLAVFITSQGEVAVYQGTDPSSAATWGLVGVFSIGAPVGYRCLRSYQGDLLMITQDGLDVASRALMSSRGNKHSADTDIISGATNEATTLYGSSFGWEVTQFADAGMLLLNVPVGLGLQEQYVMNTTTGAWCQFTGWAANCFEVFNSELYFGTNGEVRKAWTTNADLGANIVAEVVGAFDYWGSRSGQKAARMIRPVIGWDSNPAEFLLGIDVDYVIVTPTGAISFPAASGGVWDTGLWGSAIWGGDVTFNRNWYSAFGIGYALAPHLKVSSRTAEVRLAAFDFVYEKGGVL